MCLSRLCGGWKEMMTFLSITVQYKIGVIRDVWRPSVLHIQCGEQAKIVFCIEYHPFSWSIHSDIIPLRRHSVILRIASSLRRPQLCQHSALSSMHVRYEHQTQCETLHVKQLNHIPRMLTNFFFLCAWQHHMMMYYICRKNSNVTIRQWHRILWRLSLATAQKHHAKFLSLRGLWHDDFGSRNVRKIQK